jgi:oxygen-independent coproporphyrinogen-3 oxidase
MLWWRTLETQLDFAQGRHIHSVFIGGGTPSSISAQGYQWLFQLKALLPFRADCEITLEANPGTVEHDPLQIIWQQVSIACR